MTAHRRSGGEAPAEHAAPGNGFRQRLLDPTAFTVGLYVRPHYEAGGPATELLRELLEGRAAETQVDALLLSHRSGCGSLSAAALAERMVQSGKEPVVSFSQADRTRSEALGELKEYRARGVRNLLLVTGDYPSEGQRHRGEAAFDLDSVQFLMLLREAASSDEGFPRDYFIGCAVSPFKMLEPEQVWQYEKLARKIEVGAGFIVSQAGFDLRKYDELIRFCRLRKIQEPVIGSILVPDLELAAKIERGLIPGVSIPGELVKRMSEERTERERRKAKYLRAAKMMAVLKGLGYRGVLLGGSLEFEDVGLILEEAGRLYGEWEDCLEDFSPGGSRFYYFQRSKKNGLNEDRLTAVKARRRPHLMYLFSWAVDYLAFGSWKPLFHLLVRVCRFCDTRPFWKRTLWTVEYLSKTPIYGCRMCGDCTLYACGFLCYEAGCPKKMLNGPCGGSIDGYCEVDPGRELCFWVRIYDCLKWKSDRPTFTAPPIPPKDRGLDGTCSWISFCLGRDHRRISTPL